MKTCVNNIVRKKQINTLKLKNESLRNNVFLFTLYLCSYVCSSFGKCALFYRPEFSIHRLFASSFTKCSL